MENPARPIVFLGLSVHRSEACELLDADYRGPVTAGDLDAIASPADTLIIDGILDAGARLAVAEAIRALDRGVALRGAASFGAFLAAILEYKGMKGSGKVFETLRCLEYPETDLIEALYTVDQLSPITFPLINAIVHGREQGLRPEKLEALARALRSIPLEERSLERIESVSRREGVHLPIDFHAIDYKRGDALGILRVLAA